MANADFHSPWAALSKRSISQTNDEFITYRVDMPPRPFGESSPIGDELCCAGRLHQEQGRDWERYTRWF
ncbi:hypothetical protein O9992_11550 [Vibrio lentus]|nr:hypothetical protein [Vibrio lentus]